MKTETLNFMTKTSAAGEVHGILVCRELSESNTHSMHFENKLYTLEQISSKLTRCPKTIKKYLKIAKIEPEIWTSPKAYDGEKLNSVKFDPDRTAEEEAHFLSQQAARAKYASEISAQIRRSKPSPEGAAISCASGPPRPVTIRKNYRTKHLQHC